MVWCGVCECNGVVCVCECNGVWCVCVNVIVCGVCECNGMWCIHGSVHVLNSHELCTCYVHVHNM